jgi:hypothetical protein
MVWKKPETAYRPDALGVGDWHPEDAVAPLLQLPEDKEPTATLQPATQAVEGTLKPGGAKGDDAEGPSAHPTPIFCVPPSEPGEQPFTVVQV